VINAIPQLLYPGNDAGPTVYEGQSGQVQKILRPLGFDSQTVQPVPSCYTNYAILTLNKEQRQPESKDRLTLMFLNVSCSTIRLSSGIFKTSRKLEYSEWKLNSILARFITKYWAIQGQYSSVTISRSSSH
jgi:hypothetical protein